MPKQLDLEEFKRQDISHILLQNDYDLFNRENSLGDRVIMDGSSCVAFGKLQLLAEAIIMLDHTKSYRDKFEAIKLLLDACTKKAKEANLEQIHVFVENEAFASILKKHFSFEKAVGEALILTLR